MRSMRTERRRSTVSAGLLILLTATCGACSSDSEGTSGGRREPASTPSVQSEPSRTLVLGPDGVGPIKLGMTHQAVAASKAAETFVGSRHDGWPRGCRIVVYRPEALGQLDTVNGSVSRQAGLEQLSATDLMVTPEGIGLGSTLSEVRVAYGRSGIDPGETVKVRASDTAVYWIQMDSGVVTSISLELRTRHCDF